MKQPRFKMGEHVKCILAGYEDQRFQVTEVQYRTEKDMLGYQYRNKNNGKRFHEDSLAQDLPPIEPITSESFDHIWKAHLGALWYDTRTHDLYVNLKNFLEQKGFIV